MVIPFGGSRARDIQVSKDLAAAAAVAQDLAAAAAAAQGPAAVQGLGSAATACMCVAERPGKATWRRRARQRRAC